MTVSFSLTYDYLCPFARIASETAIEAIAGGADYDVRFTPFSLTQNSLAEGEPDVWSDDRPDDPGSGVRALLWSLAVRDGQPDRFADFHLGLFTARHDGGADLNDESVLTGIGADAAVDLPGVRAAIDSGRPRATLREEHTALVVDHGVFGVPTFIAGREAVFVRFMERHRVDDLDHVVRMLDRPTINEFKRTRVPR